MVSIASLWLAILLSAALVWAVSALVWMVLPYHKSDFAKLSDEDAFRGAVGPHDPSPGAYTFPHIESPKDLERPGVREKFEQGPVGFLYLVRNTIPSMPAMLTCWFAFLIVMSAIVAYVTTRTLSPGAEYMHVFQVSGTVAWMGYGLAYVQDGIFFGRLWSHVGKFVFDAFIYGCVTAGVFGWLWPA